MRAKKPNISQIIKYLQGKLDARAMHQLERQAQDDPFLMDALEGYENAGKDQQKNLADLKGQLAKRTAPAKQRSLILWRVLPIAAIMLLMVGAGYWFLKPESTKKQYVVKVTGDNLLTPPPPTVEKQIVIEPKDSKLAEKKTYKTDRTEYIAENRNVKANETVDDILKKMEGVEVNPDVSIANRSQAVAGAKLNGKDFSGGNLANAIQNLPADIVENLQIADTISKTSLIAANRPAPQLREVSISGPVTVNRNVSGKVLDQQGAPLIGATVIVDGTGKAVATDVNGNFKIDLPANKDLLAVNYIGYNTQQVKVGNRDNLNISLRNNDNSLNEVVVNAYGTNNKKTTLREEVIINGAEPIYKKDTVEYFGSDYAVRPKAPVEDILKKMVGVEVGPDGSVTFQAQTVKKVKLNGKDYMGGNVASAIKNIRADIVEKIQIINDYSDQAAKAGIRSAQPDKVLNIITYPNKKAAAAAKRTISGKVRDNQGAALIGATVSVFKTYRQGVQTDVNGNFKIDVPSNKDFLNVRYVGHNTQQVKIGKQKNLNIALEYYNYRSPSTGSSTAINCNENLKFKTTYFYNIHIVQQYAMERGLSKPTISLANLKKALLYLNKYNKVPIGKFLTDKNSINLSSISNYTSQCLKWYEENKCNNFK